MLVCYGVLASVSSMVYASSPDKISVTRADIEEIGKTMLKDEYPDRKAPGYALARGSLALMNGVAQLIKDNKIDDIQKEIISPMQSVEAVWPDRESANGQKIDSSYWKCKDAATVLRISISLLVENDTKYFETLNSLYDSKRTMCVAALLAENIKSDPEYLKKKSSSK